MSTKGGERFEKLIHKVDHLRGVHGDSQTAIALLEDTLQRESLEPGNCSILHCRLGVLYQETGQNKKAEQCYKKALRLAKKSKNNLLISDALRLHSFLSFKLDTNLDKVEKLAFEALRLIQNKRSTNAKKLKASIYELLGNISGTRGAQKEALSYFQKGLKVARRVNDTRRVATILSDIGGTYIKMGQLSKARAALNQAKQNAKEYLPVFPTLNLRYARLAFKEGDLAEAESLCQELLRFSQERGWKRDQAEAYEGLGYIYQAQQKTREAAHAFQQASNIFRDINMLTLARRARRKAQ